MTTSVPKAEIDSIAILNADVLQFNSAQRLTSSYLQASSTSFKSSTTRNLASNTKLLAFNTKSLASTERYLSATTDRAIINNISLVGFIILLAATLISGLTAIFFYINKKRKHNPLIQSSSVTSTGSDTTIMRIHKRKRDQRQEPDSTKMKEISLKITPSLTTHIINSNGGFTDIDVNV